MKACQQKNGKYGCITSYFSLTLRKIYTDNLSLDIHEVRILFKLAHDRCRVCLKFCLEPKPNALTSKADQHLLTLHSFLRPVGPTVFYQLYHIFSPLLNWFICLCECLNFCFIPCETDTHGNSWKSSTDEKCNAPMAMLRLSGSAFVPVTHCHHSHRDFPDPPSLSKLLSGAVHSLNPTWV